MLFDFDPKCDLDLEDMDPVFVHGTSSHNGLPFYIFILKLIIESGHQFDTSEPKCDFDDPKCDLDLEHMDMGFAHNTLSYEG